MYQMNECGMYGEVVVPQSVFGKLNQEYFISHSDDTVKYMCANDEEKKHLESLGIMTSNLVCDWYKIILNESGH